MPDPQHTHSEQHICPKCGAFLPSADFVGDTVPEHVCEPFSSQPQLEQFDGRSRHWLTELDPRDKDQLREINVREALLTLVGQHIRLRRLVKLRDQELAALKPAAECVARLEEMLDNDRNLPVELFGDANRYDPHNPQWTHTSGRVVVMRDISGGAIPAEQLEECAVTLPAAVEAAYKAWKKEQAT